MSGVIATVPKYQFSDSTGTPLAGGTLTTYIAGTTTLTNTWQDLALTTANTNPIVLDSRGECVLWLSSAVAYKLVLKNSSGVTQWTVDNITGADNGLRDALAASSGASLVGFLQSGTGGVATTVQTKLRESVSVKDFGAKGDGTTDDTAAIQAAINTLKRVYVPKGVYRVTSTLNIKPATAWGVFGPGAIITGDGPGSTFFDNQVASGPLFDIDSATHGGTYSANQGTVLENFQIFTTTSPAASIGIRVLNAYQVTIQNLVIKGMTYYGIELKNGAYTDDGWNRVAILNCWIDSCATWGIKADGADTPVGRNEGSYTYLRQVFFQTNGTASATSTPTSGGMIWKGQVLVMESCAFANGNQNVGLFIKGGPGLGQVVDLRSTTFENCVKRGLYCTGMSAFKGRNLQFFNNNSFVAQVACEFDGDLYTVRQVDIDGVVVRATSGNNAYTAFKLGGLNTEFNNCRVRNVTWDNFDYTGQTRFNGWQFDFVPTQAFLYVPTSTDIYLRPNVTVGGGNVVPYRLRGGLGGATSTSGEWVPRQIPAAGLLLSATTLPLVAATRYYIYLYDNTGAPALEASTTAFTVDTSTGYPVKTGDTTKFYVGSVVGGATNGTVATTASGWLNPTQISYSQTGVYAWMWYSSTSAALRRTIGTLPTSDTDGALV